jgi:glycosyltransferase involved in cell wall biosynthesis
VGLFLQAAHSILQLHPFTRFTIVGDGVLRASLEELAARLQIAWAVHFVGWVGASDLPTVLAGVDIIVNPSLRAWSETFCIANVEAMSMELPLVTFAVGGVGEYVAAPSEVGFNETTEFSVSENAVVLQHATPTAVANAVFHLVRRPELRKSIGEAARRTVESYFATSRQMRQYEELYSLLHEMTN